jgi:hypothetical protein
VLAALAVFRRIAIAMHRARRSRYSALAFAISHAINATLECAPENVSILGGWRRKFDQKNEACINRAHGVKTKGVISGQTTFQIFRDKPFLLFVAKMIQRNPRSVI